MGQGRWAATGAAMVAMLALVGGCSSGSEPAATSGSPVTTGATTKASGLPDPCSLLTRAEVNAATGSTFGDGAINTTVTQESISACDWQGPGVGTVQVLVSTVDAYDGSKGTAADVYGAADDITVPGARRAYVVRGGFLIGMDLGGTFLQVSFVTTSGGVAKAVRELATKAAARMP